MSSTSPAPLITGDYMTRDEFMQRWEQPPGFRHAELIEGTVYVSSPLSNHHGIRTVMLAHVLDKYVESTPGCEGGLESSWYMLESAPQPDLYLKTLPEFGGPSSPPGFYAAGAPELAIEVYYSSTDVDFGAKLRLYQRAGVQEYVTVEILRNRIIWRELKSGRYQDLPPEEGIFKCHIFPGLWLDAAAFWEKDRPRMSAILNRGLATPEHAAFLQHQKEPRSNKP